MLLIRIPQISSKYCRLKSHAASPYIASVVRPVCSCSSLYVFFLQSYATQNIFLYFDTQWPRVYPKPEMVSFFLYLPKNIR